MKLTQLTVSYARTLNLGNYQSAKVEMSGTFSLEEPVDPESRELRDAYRQAFKDIKARVHAECDKIQPDT